MRRPSAPGASVTFEMAGKILYLSWGIPPETTGSAIIALNLARQFTRDEMILAGEKPHARPPLQWNPAWPELLYVQLVWPVTHRGLRWWRMFQFPRTLWTCVRLVRRKGVDRILVVYPDWIFLLAGYLTAAHYGSTAFCLFPQHLLREQQGNQEVLCHVAPRRVFQTAKHVFVMSDGMSRLYAERYPGLRQTPLLHTFPEPIPEYVAPPKVASPMRLLFSGSLNALCFDAAARLGEAVLTCKDAVVSVYSAQEPQRFREIGLMPPGSSHETVARNDLVIRLKQADVLLLPHGFSHRDQAEEEFQTIFPTKTIEYLISGRPILAHSPKDCFLTQFSLENDCALVVDRADVAALREAIERLRTDDALRARLVRNALRTAEQFQGDRVASKLRMTLGLEPLWQAGNGEEFGGLVQGEKA